MFPRVYLVSCFIHHTMMRSAVPLFPRVYLISCFIHHAIMRSAESLFPRVYLVSCFIHHAIMRSAESLFPRVYLSAFSATVLGVLTARRITLWYQVYRITRSCIVQQNCVPVSTYRHSPKTTADNILTVTLWYLVLRVTRLCIVQN